jgi:hypothetical protein
MIYSLGEPPEQLNLFAKIMIGGSGFLYFFFLISWGLFVLTPSEYWLNVDDLNKVKAHYESKRRVYDAATKVLVKTVEDQHKLKQKLEKTIDEVKNKKMKGKITKIDGKVYKNPTDEFNKVGDVHEVSFGKMPEVGKVFDVYERGRGLDALWHTSVVKTIKHQGKTLTIITENSTYKLELDV